MLAAVGELPEAVDPVIVQLQSDNTDDLRLAACRALARVAPSGDPTVVAAIAGAAGAFHDPTQIVELANVLVGLAGPQGDTNVTAALLSLHKFTHCRAAVLRGLAATAPVKTEAALAAVIHGLQDPHLEVLTAAAWALNHMRYRWETEMLSDSVPQRGSEASAGFIATVQQMCRTETLASLATAALCPDLDSAVLATLRSRVQHGHWTVRIASLRGLSMLATRGCAETFAAVRTCLHDNNADVRQSAVEALAIVCFVGDQQVLDILEEMLDDPMQPIQVQVAIEEVLEVWRGTQVADVEQEAAACSQKALADDDTLGTTTTDPCLLSQSTSNHDAELDKEYPGNATSRERLSAETDRDVESCVGECVVWEERAEEEKEAMPGKQTESNVWDAMATRSPPDVGTSTLLTSKQQMSQSFTEEEQEQDEIDSQRLTTARVRQPLDASTVARSMEHKPKLSTPDFPAFSAFLEDDDDDSEEDGEQNIIDARRRLKAHAAAVLASRKHGTEFAFQPCPRARLSAEEGEHERRELDESTDHMQDLEDEHVFEDATPCSDEDRGSHEDDGHDVDHVRDVKEVDDGKPEDTSEFRFETAPSSLQTPASSPLGEKPSLDKCLNVSLLSDDEEDIEMEMKSGMQKFSRTWSCPVGTAQISPTHGRFQIKEEDDDSEYEEMSNIVKARNALKVHASVLLASVSLACQDDEEHVKVDEKQNMSEASAAPDACVSDFSNPLEQQLLAEEETCRLHNLPSGSSSWSSSFSWSTSLLPSSSFSSAKAEKKRRQTKEGSIDCDDDLSDWEWCEHLNERDEAAARVARVKAATSETVVKPNRSYEQADCTVS